LLIEGRLRRRSCRRSEVWRPAVRLVTACSGGTGPARQALRPVPRGARCTRCGGNAAAGSADPEPKNRHGGAPRGERPTLLDARRLASAWHAASSHAERVLSAAPVRLSALRPPLVVGIIFTTRAQSRRGNAMCCSHGLFDIVRRDYRSRCGLVAARRAAGRFASPLRGRHGGGEPNKNGRGVCFEKILREANPPPIRIGSAPNCPPPQGGRTIVAPA
jgi:hypothetical protein